MAHADYSNFAAALRQETLAAVVDSYEALAHDTRNWVANLANALSLVWHAYHSLGVRVNWAGFYVLDAKVRDLLVLGPFQGKVACQTIRFGAGVCGRAAETRATQLVPDVHADKAHIACDGETNSEIVVPLIVDGRTVGVLDIDCLDKDGFDAEDARVLEQLAAKISQSCDW